jgi:hypothetical protein
MEFKGDAGGRMGEAQFCCVQKISMGLAESFYELFQGSLAINNITDHGMTNGCQMHTNLMRPTRFDFQLEQSEFTELFQDTIFGVR